MQSMRVIEKEPNPNLRQTAIHALEQGVWTVISYFSESHKIVDAPIPNVSNDTFCSGGRDATHINWVLTKPKPAQ